jgi:hypothetical protein
VHNERADNKFLGRQTPLSNYGQPYNCFVAMFDIIGFKALRARKGTQGLHQLYVRFIDAAIQHSAAGSGKVETINGKQKYVPNRSLISCDYVAISDTVVFHTADDSFISFLSIVNSSYELLKCGFSGAKIPFRGAVGWGDIIHNQSGGVLIGSAIEDAYAGECSQVWSGCMLTEQCMEFVQQKNYIDAFHSLPHEIAQRLVNYECVPTQVNPKDGPIRYSIRESHVINWTLGMYEGAAEKAFHISSDSHAQKIAKHTKDFENWARRNNIES